MLVIFANLRQTGRFVVKHRIMAVAWRREHVVHRAVGAELRLRLVQDGEVVTSIRKRLRTGSYHRVRRNPGQIARSPLGNRFPRPVQTEEFEVARLQPSRPVLVTFTVRERGNSRVFHESYVRVFFHQTAKSTAVAVENVVVRSLTVLASAAEVAEILGVATLGVVFGVEGPRHAAFPEELPDRLSEVARISGRVDSPAFDENPHRNHPAGSTPYSGVTRGLT